MKSKEPDIHQENNFNNKQSLFNMTTNDIYLELTDQIRINNDSHNMPSEQSLFNILSDLLQSSGQIAEELIEIEYGVQGFNFSAFSRDIERGALNLFLTDLYTSPKPEKIFSRNIEKFFSKLINLFESSLIPSKNDLDESNPIKEFLDDLSDSNHYQTLKFWYLTNGIYSSRDIPDLSLALLGKPTSLQLIDLAAYKSMIRDFDQQNIQIFCSLNAIKVIENTDYTSYLTNISGNELAKYYHQYGKRLLESNVRTFLSLRGNVNKGIYNTLRSDDNAFFFAYNNGLSGTATGVHFENNTISSVKNLQIVNGGQTMSTIYKAQKDGINIDQVQVQLKLSVLHETHNYAKHVAKISEYANTQNKVNRSDFFSNTYFHRRFKELSKILRVPALGNQSYSSKWFYERVKGEYINDQLYMKDSERKKFLLEYPKNQVVDKIIISKASMSWDLYPYEVSKGAQLCFAKFAEKVSNLYEEGDADCNEYLFKKTISQVILYKEVQKLVSHAEWYSGGYRAQTVPYIISVLSYKLNRLNQTINWESIWGNQGIEEDLKKWLYSVGSKIHYHLINPPPGNTNIGTYCKKILCWNGLKSTAKTLPSPPQLKSFINTNINKQKILQEKQKAKLDTGVSNQIRVLELSRTQTPKKLIEYYNSKYSPGITDLGRGVLKSWYEGRIEFPTEKQAKILIDVLENAINSGFTGIK